MAVVDPILALRELMRKRFVELATEMPLKSRRALKEILDQVVTQVSNLQEEVEELRRRSAQPKKAAPPKKTKAKR
jgi:polyhydroxyalkanoate synthesis regulator phasin